MSIIIKGETMAELEGEKSALRSQTIQGSILSIIATAGTVAALILQGVPYDILIPTIVSSGAAIWGSLLSVFGRYKATEKIK